MDSIEQELTFSVPTLGWCATKENEIATTDRALESLGIEPKVGAEVEIEFELRNQIHQYKMVVSGIWEAPNSQTSLMLVSDKLCRKMKKYFHILLTKTGNMPERIFQI